MTARRDSIQRIVRGETATVEAYAPYLGIASSAEYRFVTPATSLPTTFTPFATGTDGATTTAAASQGATSITVDSLPIARFAKRYVIGPVAASVANDAIEIEIQPHGAITNGAVTLSEPLPCDIATGATLISNRLTVDLSAADTAELGVGAVEWSVTFTDGVNHKFSVEFLVVERDATYTLTPTTLTQSSPYCRDKRPDTDADFTEMIDAAWRRYVEPALLAKALKPERIVHGRFIESAHIAACEYYMAQQFDPERLADMKTSYTDALARVLANPDLWVVSEDEALTAPPAAAVLPVFDVCFITR